MDITKCKAAPKNAKKGQLRYGNIDDPNFCRLLLRLLDLNGLSVRETKYLLLRFYFKMTNNQIIKFEGLDITRQAVNNMIQDAYKKIREKNSGLRSGFMGYTLNEEN